MLRRRAMRHFTDAAAAQLEQQAKEPACAYELVLDDGRLIQVPDYPALLKTIAQLEDESWTLRVRGDGNGSPQHSPRRE